MSSNPAWATGYVPSALEWNNTFGGKADEAEMAAKVNTTDMNAGLALKQNSAGTTTNDNAAAGQIGEYQTNTTTATSLSTGVSTNVATLSLTAGDWDVWGGVAFRPAGTTTVAGVSCCLNTSSATLAGFANGLVSLSPGFTTGANQIMQVGMQRISLAAPGTVFMVAGATFAVSTMTADGFIAARRVR